MWFVPLPPPIHDRPLRKDALRSRRLVLDAARALFARRGLDVGFDEIARTAGVGVGTVYRRFPDREALLEALFAEKIEEVVAVAVSALEIDDPWDSLVTFCERSVVEQQRDRGLAQVMASGARGQEHLAELRDRVGSVVEQILRRAQQDGAVRADVELVDVILMLHLIARASPGPDSALWRRYLALFLDGLRERGGDSAPLPGPAPSLERFHEIAHDL